MVVLVCQRLFKNTPLVLEELFAALSNAPLQYLALLCRNAIFPLYKPRNAFYLTFRGEINSQRQKWYRILCGSFGKSSFFFSAAQIAHKYWEYILISNLTCDIW